MRLRIAPVTGFALAIAVAGSGAATLHWHIAAAVALGFAVGILAAIPRFGPTLAAVFLSPLLLLSYLVLATNWGAMDMVTVLSLVVGGALLCSLLPYAVARWSRRSFATAALAWLLGLVLTAQSAIWLTSRLPEPEGGRLATDHTNQTLPAMNALSWTEHNGGGETTLHFAFEGRVHMPECRGLYSYTYEAHIPPAARHAVERFTYEPLPVSLRQWFAGSADAGLEVPCNVAIHGNANQAVHLSGTCSSSSAMRDLARLFPNQRLGLDLQIPTIRLQGPLLVPNAGSQLRIDAPRDCIDHTFPHAARIEQVGQREELILNVGFPRGLPGPTDAGRFLTDPSVVHIELIEPSQRGSMRHKLVRTLDTRSWLIALFLAAALAAAVLVRPVYRRLAAFARSRARSWFSRSTGSDAEPRPVATARFARLIVKATAMAAIAIAAALMLPVLGLAWTLAGIDPVYSFSAKVFLLALGLIELVAFTIRRASRRTIAPIAAGDA